MKNITIIPNPTKDGELKVTRRLIELLSGRAELIMEERYASLGSDVHYRKNAELYTSSDCAIVIGGDGTILQAAEPCARLGIPIMGINMGTVGFMTELEVSAMEEGINALLEGRYTTQKRMMMRVDIEKQNGTRTQLHVLNDIVISKKDAAMISAELYSNGEKINEYIADGLILSTPTGSTGYSLSAGGPVADPTMELFIATPICAHMLSSRPALIGADKEIKIVLTGRGAAEAFAVADGEVRNEICAGDCISATKSAYTADIIKIFKQSFYDIMKSKL